MTTLVNSKITYTPEILRSYQNVEVRTDSTSNRASFEANANVLASVCSKLHSLLEETAQDESTVLIFSGFSESLMENLEHFIHTGFLNVDNDQLEDLKDDFKFLGVPVNDKFWSTEVPVPNVKIEIKEDEDSVLDFSSGSLNQTSTTSEDVPMVDTDFSIEKMVSTSGREADKRQLLECWLCPQKLFRPYRLIKHVAARHKEYLHLVQGPYKCNNCSASFASMGVYYRHITTPRTGCTVECICAECGKKCRSKKELDKHTSYAHAKGEVPCDICGKVFMGRTRMTIHKSRQHNEKHCEHCSQVFKGMQALNQHVRSIHVVNDEKPFLCNVCGKGFGRKQPYMEHMDIHNNIKRYKCRFCDYRFVSSSNKSKHEKSAHSLDLVIPSKQE